MIGFVGANKKQVLILFNSVLYYAIIYNFIDVEKKSKILLFCA